MRNSSAVLCNGKTDLKVVVKKTQRKQLLDCNVFEDHLKFLVARKGRAWFTCLILLYIFFIRLIF